MTAWRTVLTVHKAVLAIVVVASVFGAEFNSGQFRSAYAHWSQVSIPTLSSRFATWDSAHYLVLSQAGYEAGSPSCAFFPLWPATIRAAAPLTFGNPLVAALVLTNGLSLVSLRLFYRLVEPYGEVTARQAVIILLAFPGAIFFSFPYTESLYLTMLLVFFRGIQREAYFWPFVMSFLMPLTKAIGVFIVLPLAWHLYEQRKALRFWLLLSGPIFGYATYFCVIYLNTGNPFEGFAAQRLYPYSPSIQNMFNLRGICDAFLNSRTWHGMMDSALDRGFFVLFLALLPLIYRLNKTWFWYTLPTGLVPALTSYFMSYRRYVMVCFPVFVVLAQLLAKTKSRWMFWYYVALLGALQAWAVKEFVNFNWAG